MSDKELQFSDNWDDMTSEQRSEALAELRAFDHVAVVWPGLKVEKGLVMSVSSTVIKLLNATLWNRRTGMRRPIDLSSGQFIRPWTKADEAAFIASITKENSP